MKNGERAETIGHEYLMKNGILHVYVKPGVPTLEAIEESCEFMKSLGGKHKILVDPTDATMLNKTQRLRSAECFERFATAVAMINGNLFVPLLFNFAKKIQKVQFPLQIFKKREAALNWLNSI